MTQRQEIIERLNGLEMEGGSHAMLSAICKAVLPHSDAWTLRRCADLRDRLVRLLGEVDTPHSSDGRITDELRGLAEDPLLGYASQETHKEIIIAIADRIDAEHEQALGSKVAMAISVGEDGTEFVSMPAKELAERYVESPKGADGEYIHEHGKVDWRDHAGTWHENKTVVAVCHDGCYVMDGTVFCVHKSDIRHHHAPTVEEVLREFALRVTGRECMTARPDVLAEYVAKLRLADDGKEQ